MRNTWNVQSEIVQVNPSKGDDGQNRQLREKLAGAELEILNLKAQNILL